MAGPGGAAQRANRRRRPNPDESLAGRPPTAKHRTIPLGLDKNATKARSIVSRQSRNVLFWLKFTLQPLRVSGPAIPSIKIVLHRGQPSRLPSGAKAGGLDGTRPRCDKNSREEGMARLGLAAARQNRTFLLCRKIGHFYFAPTEASQRSET